MQLLLALGNDGILREYDWRGINDISTGFLKEEVIEDVSEAVAAVRASRNAG